MQPPSLQRQLALQYLLVRSSGRIYHCQSAAPRFKPAWLKVACSMALPFTPIAEADLRPAGSPLSFHALISVLLDRDQIEAIGARGWRTKYLGRGAPGREPFFHVIEMWVENNVMLELATANMLAPYLATMDINRLQQRFPAGVNVA